MEEDIKILERMLEIEKECLHYDVSQDEIQAIKNLINRNKELEKQVDLEYVEENYIEKSKVIPKSKIEELTEELEYEKIKIIKNRHSIDYGIFIEKLKKLDIQMETLQALRLNPECKWFENN